jgi:hypothetical protein
MKKSYTPSDMRNELTPRTIKNELNQDSIMESSIAMDLSQVSQRQHIWKSKETSPPKPKQAVDTLYVGNNKHDFFTSSYSNVWQTTSELMFHDHHLGSD